MKPTVERLTEQFKELIGPEAFAQAEAAVAAAKAAAEKAAAVVKTNVAGLPGSPTPATVMPKPAAPRPVPAAAPAPIPSLPVQPVKHAEKGYDFEATVAASQVVLAAGILDGQGFGLDAITGVDWIAQNEMEVVYDFFHPIEPIRVVVRARIPRPTPELPTISTVFQGANWHEREAHDFFGITFTGHPNLAPFLLPEDAKFHPLRKDYQP